MIWCVLTFISRFYPLVLFHFAFLLHSSPPFRVFHTLLQILSRFFILKPYTFRVFIPFTHSISRFSYSMLFHFAFFHSVSHIISRFLPPSLFHFAFLTLCSNSFRVFCSSIKKTPFIFSFLYFPSGVLSLTPGGVVCLEGGGV